MVVGTDLHGCYCKEVTSSIHSYKPELGKAEQAWMEAHMERGHSWGHNWVTFLGPGNPAEMTLFLSFCSHSKEILRGYLWSPSTSRTVTLQPQVRWSPREQPLLISRRTHLFWYTTGCLLGRGSRLSLALRERTWEVRYSLRLLTQREERVLDHRGKESSCVKSAELYFTAVGQVFWAHF